MAEPDIPFTSHDMKHLRELKEEESSQAEDTSLVNIVWWKIDRRILPLCATFFLLAAVVGF